MTTNPPENANKCCVGPQSENAGKASSCKGCPNVSSCLSGEARKKDPDIQLIANRLDKIKYKVLVMSGKGGVGKSSFTSQFAWFLSQKSLKNVGVLDVDICGPSIPRLFGVEEEEIQKSEDGWLPVTVNKRISVMSVGFMLSSRSDAIVWRGPRKNGLIRQFLSEVKWPDVEFLLIDTPPGTSDEHISTVRYLEDSNVNGAIIVTTPQEISLLDVRKELTFCKKVGVKVLGVVENMRGFVCPHCRCSSDLFLAEGNPVEKMCEEFGVKYLGALPMDPQFGKSCDKGISFFKGDNDDDIDKNEKTGKKKKNISKTFERVLNEICS